MFRRVLLSLALAALASCGEDKVVATFSIGGQVDGLEGRGLVLQNNSSDEVTVAADGPFHFEVQLATDQSYNVRVKTQPSEPTQRCTVTNGAGTVAGVTVSDVQVTCSTLSFSIGGTVSGLEGTGLVLKNNGADDVTVNANGPFQFPTPVASGEGFNASVHIQPTNPTQVCVVQNGFGILGAEPVTTIEVVCRTNPIALGGAVNGLVGTGLVLQNNGKDDLAVAPGARSYSFTAPRDAPYAITVKAQPGNPKQTCTVARAAGVAGKLDISDIDVTCVTDLVQVGGSVTGLTGAGLVLRNSDGTDLSVAAGATSYHFNVPSNGSYAIAVKTQPSNPVQTCTIVNASGTVADQAVTNAHVSCSTQRFTVGGTITGLIGSGLVLQNNGADDQAVPPGASLFSFSVASAATYAVSVKTQPSNPSQVCAVVNANGVVGSANVTDVRITCATTTFALRGTVTGLVGAGLVLQNNGGSDLAVPQGSTEYAFSVASNSAYAVTVKTQPSNPAQVCTVANATGSVGSADVTGVNVTCATSTFLVGGNVVGLTGTGLVLQNNGAGDQTIAANATGYTFNVLSGASYSISIKTQPSSPTQTCAVANPTGTVAGANVVNVHVTCSTSTFTVGGTVSGLTGTGLVLQNNAGSDLPVAAGAPSYAFTVPSGSPYAVTVKTQPSSPSQICTVANGTGAVSGANVTNVHVTCVTAAFTVGGTITGLVGTGLVLQNLASNDLPVAAGAGSYSFPANSGSSYAITVKTQPSSPTQVCTVANNTGTVAGANVVNANVTCTTTSFTVGGSITGLIGTGLTLQNNAGGDLSITAGATSYSFTAPSGSGYAVTVKTQPSNPWQVCNVANATGTVGATNVTNVAITCTTSTFTVGGSVSGLAGTGLVLVNNGGGDQTIAKNATSYSFSVASNNPYAISVKVHPSSPTQTCTVASPTGTVTNANVANVNVTCTTTSFNVGGSITGLLGTGLVLQNNGGGDLSRSPGATSYAFSVPSGGGYSVTVKTQPTSPTQVCTVANPTGTVGAADVTTASITCVTSSFKVGGSISGLVGTGLVLHETATGADSAVSPGATSYDFSVPSGATYTVSVKTQPSNPAQVCSVANPTATVPNGDVTNVNVTCACSPYCPRVVLLAGTTSGTANHLAGSYVPGGTWTTERLAGSTLSGADVALLNDGTAIGLVRNNSDDLLKFTKWNGSAWSALAAIGADVKTRGKPSIGGGSPAEVVFHGQDFLHYQLHYDGTWSAPYRVGLRTNPPDPLPTQAQVYGPSAPVVLNRGLGAFTVAYIEDSSNRPTIVDYEPVVWQLTKNLGTERTNYTKTPAIVAPAAGTRLVVWITEFGSQLRYASYAGGVWSAPSDVPSAQTNHTPALVATGGGEVLLAFRGTDDNLYTVTFNGSSWLGAPAQVPDIASKSLAAPPALAKGQGGMLAELAYVSGTTAFHRSLKSDRTWTSPVTVGTSVDFVSIAAGP